MSRANQNPVLLSARGIRTNVRKERGSWHEVVSGVGIDIGRAEIMSLIGESGAGKSMLAHSLIRIPSSAQVLFSAGEVWFDGRDLCRLSEPDLRIIRGYHLTMMFQDAAKCLHPRMRCGAQLAAVYQRYAKGREGQAGESIARLGLDPGQILSRYPHEVSGGMKQLVYLAMALACPASLLILDEPTTALDAVTRQQVLNVLRERRETRGTALLVITHDLALASLVADRLLVMYAGMLVESLPTSALPHAVHPYLIQLLDCTPEFNPSAATRTPHTPHRPRPIELTEPPGCCYASRCPLAIQVCQEKAPAWEEVRTGHWVACHRSAETVQILRSEIERPDAQDASH